MGYIHRDTVPDLPAVSPPGAKRDGDLRRALARAILAYDNVQAARARQKGPSPQLDELCDLRARFTIDLARRLIESEGEG